MPDLNMPYGPFDLTNEEIDNRVKKGCIGNYAYGYTEGEAFYVMYVGRSDDDLNARIKHGVGKYKKFMFSYAPTTKAAFEKECKNWHDFGGLKGGLDNKMHPDKPDGTDYECPYCNDMQHKIQLKLSPPRRFRR